MNETIEILEKMDSLLATEANWQKGRNGFDKDSPNCGCLLGAWIKARDLTSGPHEKRGGYEAYRIVTNIAGTSLLSFFNDAAETTFADVKRVIRTAIDKAKSLYPSPQL